MTRPLRTALALAFVISMSACAIDAPSPPPAAVAAPAPPVLPPAAITTTPPDPQVLGEWRIEQARSAPLVDKRAARFDLKADGTISGNASCNSFGSRYTLEGNKLRIGPLATTRKACGESLMEQEDRVLSALERAARATVPPHGFLTVQDADGAVLMRGSRFDAPK